MAGASPRRPGANSNSGPARRRSRSGTRTTGEEDPSPDAARSIADLGPAFGPGGQRLDGWPDRGRKATSPDGRRIANLAFDEPVVHVKDAATDRVLTTLRGHTGPIWCTTFSPDGKRIATAGHDQTIKIWDAEDGRHLLTLRGHNHVVTCVTFSPDGYLLASGGIDTTARVWDATPFLAHDLHEQEARRIIFPLYPWTYQFKDELIERLRVDSTRSAGPRGRISDRRVAGRRSGTPGYGELDVPQVSLRVRPGPIDRQHEYLRALRRAEAAMRLSPENGTYSTTLGIALYRVGRYREALEAGRAIALDTAKRGGPTPTVPCFSRDGSSPARPRGGGPRRVGVLRSRMRDPDATKVLESQAFLDEAEALIVCKSAHPSAR